VGIVNYKKIGIFLGIAFAAYYLISQPQESAGLVRDALGGIGDAAGKLAEFVRSLVR
jgi:hypothetical protein